MNPKIIVAGFRREQSIKRLLKSLENAKYPPEGADITISLDGGHSAEVLQTGLDFKDRFDKGNVEIIARQENIGLRNHILWCGEQTKKHGAVIILEDDLYVDPQFFMYAVAALKHYSEEDDVAGIALYSQRYNEYIKQPFLPLENGYSTYLMQVACSWGQLWSAKQWTGFHNWYQTNLDTPLEDILELPAAVKNWSDRSWKKYYSAYLAETGKYYAYPYRSYTTNCSDPGGEHLTLGSTLYQVPLSLASRPADQFSFCDFDSEVIRYDAFMEANANIIIKNFDLNANEDEVCIDFYGSKPKDLVNKFKYILSSKPSSNPIKKFKLSFKPFEMTNLFGASDEGEISFSKVKDIQLGKHSNYYNLTTYLSGFSAVNKQFIPQLFTQVIKRLLLSLGSRQ